MHIDANVCAEMNISIASSNISEWKTIPKWKALNPRITELAEQELTMQNIADILNTEGQKSLIGKSFYAKLVGVLLSKARRKSESSKVKKTVVTRLM